VATSVYLIFVIRMMEAMEVELLAKAEASPEYRGLILGLAEEALERKVI
jgi:hypothetical protein